MGGARARWLAERLRLSSTFSVASGWTMACCTRGPPQVHARPPTGPDPGTKSSTEDSRAKRLVLPRRRAERDEGRQARSAVATLR